MSGLHRQEDARVPTHVGNLAPDPEMACNDFIVFKTHPDQRDVWGSVRFQRDQVSEVAAGDRSTHNRGEFHMTCLAEQDPDTMLCDMADHIAFFIPPGVG
jgi:hypothetical protein